MTKHGDGRVRIPSTQRVEVVVAELLSRLKFVGSMQMLKIHRNEKDEVVKHRTRVYIQKPGLDFQEVFTPTCDPDGDPLRTFRTIACRFISSTSRCQDEAAARVQSRKELVFIVG